MNILQKQKIIDLTTELQVRCIAYGRAKENQVQNSGLSTRWLKTCEQKWKVAEDELREYLETL